VAQRPAGCPFRDRLTDTPEYGPAGNVTCCSAVSYDQSVQWSGDRGLNGSAPGWGRGEVDAGSEQGFGRTGCTIPGPPNRRTLTAPLDARFTATAPPRSPSREGLRKVGNFELVAEIQ